MTIEEIARKAAGEIGQFYGRSSFERLKPDARIPSCADWLLSFWKRFPRHAPDVKEESE